MELYAQYWKICKLQDGVCSIGTYSVQPECKMEIYVDERNISQVIDLWEREIDTINTIGQIS